MWRLEKQGGYDHGKLDVTTGKVTERWVIGNG